MGVPIKLPYTPPFEIVKVPPAMSAIEMVPSRAFLASALIAYSSILSTIWKVIRDAGMPHCNSVSVKTGARWQGWIWDGQALAAGLSRAQGMQLVAARLKGNFA